MDGRQVIILFRMIKDRLQNGKVGGCPRYDDWVCLMCRNLNYSFRLQCNRCHTQTKQHNADLQADLQCLQSLQELELLQRGEDRLIHCAMVEEFCFPNVLFFTLNCDPWEEQPQKKDTPDQLDPQWVHMLIGE